MEHPQLFDSIHHSDGVSLLDLGLILGCIGMLLGSIYGFVLEWGPIIWGMIGLFIGTAVGVLTKYLFIRKNRKMTRFKKKKTEVFLTIKCNEKQAEQIKDILFGYNALGIGYLKIHKGQSVNSSDTRS